MVTYICDSMVSKGQFVGLDWNRITRLHSQVMTGTQEVKNSLTASRCHLKAYPRCDQPTSKGFKSHLGLGFFSGSSSN